MTLAHNSPYIYAQILASKRNLAGLFPLFQQAGFKGDTKEVIERVESTAEAHGV